MGRVVGQKCSLRLAAKVAVSLHWRAACAQWKESSFIHIQVNAFVTCEAISKVLLTDGTSKGSQARLHLTANVGGQQRLLHSTALRYPNSQRHTLLRLVNTCQCSGSFRVAEPRGTLAASRYTLPWPK